jgi:hypothetical protein
MLSVQLNNCIEATIESGRFLVWICANDVLSKIFLSILCQLTHHFFKFVSFVVCLSLANGHERAGHTLFPLVCHQVQGHSVMWHGKWKQAPVQESCCICKRRANKNFAPWMPFTNALTLQLVSSDGLANPEWDGCVVSVIIEGWTRNATKAVLK